MEFLGISVAAISGVIAGRGRGVDLFGACFLGVLTAFGGGTVRDLILYAPVAWTRDTPLLGVALGVSVITFFAAKRRENARWMQSRVFWWADAGTLALFSVLGCAKALSHGMTAPCAMILGMLTGIFGGMVRDTMLGQIPLVFRRDQHFYATASLVGVGAQVVARPWLAENSLAVGAVCVLATRLVSCRFNVRWPAFSESKNDDWG